MKKNWWVLLSSWTKDEMLLVVQGEVTTGQIWQFWSQRGCIEYGPHRSTYWIEGFSRIVIPSFKRVCANFQIKMKLFKRSYSYTSTKLDVDGCTHPLLHSASTCCLLACFFYSIHSAYMAMYQWYELCFEIMKRPRYTSWLSFRLCWFSFDWSPWTAIRQWTNDKIYPDHNYTWSRSIDTDIIQTLVVILKQVNLMTLMSFTKKAPRNQMKVIASQGRSASLSWGVLEKPESCYSTESSVGELSLVLDVNHHKVMMYIYIHFTWWNSSPQRLLVWAYLLALALSQSHVLKKMVA